MGVLVIEEIDFIFYFRVPLESFIFYYFLVLLSIFLVIIIFIFLFQKTHALLCACVRKALVNFFFVFLFFSCYIVSTIFSYVFINCFPKKACIMVGPSRPHFLHSCHWH